MISAQAVRRRWGETAGRLLESYREHLTRARILERALDAKRPKGARGVAVEPAISGVVERPAMGSDDSDETDRGTRRSPITPALLRYKAQLLESTK